MLCTSFAFAQLALTVTKNILICLNWKFEKMKFSQVFVVLSAFLAMSLAAPSNWEEDEKLVLR